MFGGAADTMTNTRSRGRMKWGVYPTYVPKSPLTGFLGIRQAEPLMRVLDRRGAYKVATQVWAMAWRKAACSAAQALGVSRCTVWLVSTGRRV